MKQAKRKPCPCTACTDRLYQPLAPPAGEVEWLDGAGLSDDLLPQAEDEDGEGSDGEGAAPHDEEEYKAAVEAFTAKVEGWRSAGLRLVARGQAACVLVSGGTTLVPITPASYSPGFVDSAEVLRASADVGLPSAKPLLQVWAEKLARLQLMAAALHGGLQAALPW